MKSNITEFAGT